MTISLHEVCKKVADRAARAEDSELAATRQEARTTICNPSRHSPAESVLSGLLTLRHGTVASE
jgi:hypothetical protein